MYLLCRPLVVSAYAPAAFYSYRTEETCESIEKSLPSNAEWVGRMSVRIRGLTNIILSEELGQASLGFLCYPGNSKVSSLHDCMYQGLNEQRCIFPVLKLPCMNCTWQDPETFKSQRRFPLDDPDSLWCKMPKLNVTFPSCLSWPSPGRCRHAEKMLWIKGWISRL